MPPRVAIALVIAISAIACMRVAMTHAVFSPTYDEPLHVAAGFEFVAEHRYRTGTDNPPLARAFFAFPLRHARPTVTEGNERASQIFDAAGSYMRGVVLARRGNLVFLAAAIIGTALFAYGWIGTTGAVVAAALFSLLPPVLAHGGLATTDIAGTAGFALAMFALQQFLQRQTLRSALGLGAAVAFLLLTKFTFIGFFVVCALVLMKRFSWRLAVVALAVALTVVYSVYLYAHAAPRFLIGLFNVIRISSRGQDAYLLGEVRHTGWWYYFPLVLAIKTPIPFLLLAAAGKRWRIGAIALLILAVSMTSKANLGVRHILPIYVPLATLAGAAILRFRLAGGVLAAWLVVNSALAHPDYLPWMNAFAGQHPERVVVDSNFDWGQDVLRLAEECRRRNIGAIHVELFGTVDFQRIGLPPTSPINPEHPESGWFAVSESFIIPAEARNPAAYRWLTENRSFIRVGKSIRLYELRTTMLRNAFPSSTSAIARLMSDSG